MKKILIFLLLDIWLLSSVLCIYANEDKSPFSLTIVFPLSYDVKEKMIYGNKSYFHVLLKNISNEPQRIWKEWCSWGYYNLSFEMISEGKKILIKQGLGSWLKNYPDSGIINPNEYVVFDVNWLNFPDVKHTEKKRGELKAIYEVKADDESKSLGVWTGRVESAPVEITIIGWHDSASQR